MGKRIIRTSDRSTFRDCRQEWDWSSKIRQNLEPSERYAPFEDGTSWHNTLETYYDPTTWHLVGNPNTVEAVFHSARETLLDTHTKQIAQAISLNGDQELPLERMEEYSDRLKMLQGMLEHYFVWAPTVDNFKPIKIEIEFEVPIYIYDDGFTDGTPYNIDGDEVVYQGRLDGIVQDPQGRYWILEHKTASQLGRTEWLELDAQCGSYAWAIQKQLGVKVAGIIYSQALKAAPKPPTMLVTKRQGRAFSVNKQQRTTYDLFKTELEKHGEPVQNYSEFLNYLRDQGNPFFRRIEVYRNAASLNYMGETIFMEAREMLNDPVIYPSPGMFNCNFCRFREPCIAKQNGYDYQFILDELYTERSKS